MAERFTPGSLYFIVSYLDHKLTIPDIVSVIFLGKNVDGEGDGLWYFQDAESYRDLGPYPENAVGEGEIFVLPDKGLMQIADISGLIDELAACAKRSNRSARPK